MALEAARIPEAFSRRGLVTASVALGIRQAGVAAVTAVGVLALSHLLRPAQFAYYGWTMAVVTAVMAVGDLGYGGALIRSGRARELAPEAIARHRRRVVPVALGAGLVIALAPVDAAVRVPALLLAVTGLLLAAQMVPTAVFEADGRFAAIGAIEVLQRCLLIGGAVLLAAVFGSGWAAPAAAAFSALVGASLVRAFAHPAPTTGDARGEGLDVGFSRSWLTGRIAGQVNYGVYPVVGTALLSAQHLGMVLWALSVSALPALGSQLSARILFPTMVTRDRMAPAVHLRVVVGLVFVGGPLVGAMIVFAEPLTRLVFGTSWLPAVTVLQIECVNTVLGLVLTPTTPVLYLVSRPAMIGRLLLSYAALTWVLAAVLAGPLGVGVTAISIGTLISTGAMLVVVDFVLRRAGAPGLSAVVAPLVAVGALTALGVVWHPTVHSLPALVALMIAWSAAGVAILIPFRKWLTR